ncbi:MAG: hypothetical protein Q7K43_04695 [Candidatus Woesearchaeota archaeon]|nr:hypothetical protein [Candidatus Woesearchaeota archaeon]
MITLIELIAKMETKPSAQKAFCEHLLKNHPVHGINGTNPQTQASIGAVVANFFANKNAPTSQNAFTWHVDTYSPITQYPLRYVAATLAAVGSGIVTSNTLFALGTEYQRLQDLSVFQMLTPAIFGATLGYIFKAIKKPI